MENVTPEAAYLTKGTNIVHQLHTISDALPAAAKTQHLSKADAEVTAQEVRGRGHVADSQLNTIAVTGGSINKGR
jgi:hypothetical protein